MSHSVTVLVTRSSDTVSLWLRPWLACFTLLCPQTARPEVQKACSRERQINSAAGGAQGREEYAQLRVATVGSLRRPSSVGPWGKKADDSEIRHGSESPFHHSPFGTLTFGEISNCSHTHQPHRPSDNP